MKTYIVNSTKTVKRSTVVEARSSEEARRLVKSGEAFIDSVDIARSVANTVQSVKEVRD